MANMIVSGAGTSAVNGTYVESGTFEGRPKYVYDNYIILWDSSAWVIGTSDYVTAYYYSNEDVATPDLCTTWKVADGEPPVPTVTKEVTGVPKHFLYYARMRGN